MTPPDDSQRDDPAKGTPEGPVEPDLSIDRSPDRASGDGFDEDAAWRLIVENYGERAQLGSSAEPVAPPVEPHRGPVFDRSYLDALDARPQEPAAQEHFVPPDPPPVPRGTPARRLAWAGLFAPPLLMILAVVFRWTFPTWLSMGLVMAFVGGFVYLVATMPRDGGDGWDDGAVV